MKKRSEFKMSKIIENYKKRNKCRERKRIRKNEIGIQNILFFLILLIIK